MPAHYHVTVEDGTDYTYRRKADADACLANMRERADMKATDFTLDDVADRTVRSCSTPACVGADG